VVGFDQRTVGVNEPTPCLTSAEVDGDSMKQVGDFLWFRSSVLGVPFDASTPLIG